MDPNGAFSIENARAILVVDDDPQVLKWVCKMLVAPGGERPKVLSALSAAEAYELWKVHQAEIDLLVSDFVMPGTTGDRLAVNLLREKPCLRVLFISGNDPNSLDSVIPLTPGRNFLQKPFTVSEIQRSIQNLALAE
jgi:two-component system, cell cycle sensor histidine kinase and response regulator CckA